ncbi:Serine/threonine-protein kinase Genghis Khan [Gryllus bimaculatus]|nr:Serine/threonine-protein kinase Genghis Khan [Gryllus bimaculatus]
MEPCKEPVSVRITRLNNFFLGRGGSAANTLLSKQFIGREGLLDALVVLYDECNNDALKKDKNIAKFVEKFRGVVSELRRLRVNLADFEVKKVIGRGHFGEVQVVREKQTGDVYAMKTLRKSDTLSQQGAAFYQEERDIMAQTTSPWLTFLQYAFQDMNNLYLVMEFHPGGDLLALLERFEGSISEEMARFYSAELAMAIHSLHNMGYVHRDIKPDNVLVDRCGHLKLADFGSAARLTAAGVVTSQLPIGTPEYIAPEVLQALDQNSNGSKQLLYGKECDYWSLGVVAYEMVIGRTPFFGEQLSATYHNIMSHQSTLQFPEDTNTSQSFRQLVTDLLQEAAARLNHEKILKHSFFSSIDWSRLRDSVPPFVPVVNSEDDTSNFEEFEQEPRTPSIENFKSRREFSGKDLPFIGFTYTHDASHTQLLSSSVSEKDKGSATESLLAAKKKEIEDLYRKLQEAQQPKKINEMNTLERKLEECSRRLQTVEADRCQLEVALEKFRNESQSLKRALTLEREDRKMLETNAISMIRDSKTRWEKKRQQEQQQLQKCIEDKEQMIAELISEKEGLQDKIKQLDERLKKTQWQAEELQSTVDQNKNAMAKVREKTRMSIAGVETHLQKIVADKQHQVTSLQEQLDAQMKLTSELQNRIEELETSSGDRMLELTSECQQLKKENKKLHSEIKQHMEANEILMKNAEETKKKTIQTENARIVDLEETLSQERLNYTKLNEQFEMMEKHINELKQEQEKHTSFHSEKLEEHQTLICTVETELKESMREKMDLKCSLEQKTEELLCVESEKKSLEEKLLDAKKLISRFEEDNLRLKEQITNLRENKTPVVSSDNAAAIAELAQKKAFMEAQVEKLEAQLEKIRENLVLERDSAKTLQSQLWKREKELSDAKIDLRIAQREARTAEQELKTLQEEKSKWAESASEERSAHAQEIRSNWDKIEALHEEQKVLRAELEEKSQKIFELTKNVELEKTGCEEEKRKLTECIMQLKSAQDEISQGKRLMKSLESQVSSLLSEVETLKRYNQRSSEEKDKLSKQLEEQKNCCHTLEMNISVLKETCGMLEEQLEDYEKISAAYEEREKKNSSEIVKLQEDIEKLQGEIRTARQATNEEKSLKIRAELKLQQTEAEITSQSEIVTTLQDQLLDYKKLAETLTDQVTVLENTCGEHELALRTANRQLEVQCLENTELKEEIAQHLTTIHGLRESAFKLSREIEEASEQNKDLENRLLYLQAEMDEQRVYHQHREIKSDATIQQQIKLIDFLQRSLSEHSKKKKTLTDKLFGRQKENLAPKLTASVTNRDLQSQLAQERGKVKLLSEQLVNAKAQLQKKSFACESSTDKVSVPSSPNTRRVLSQIVQSPGTQQRRNFERQPSLQRMHHNIPHRFEPKLSMRVTKCAVCLDSIHFGRHAAVCQECHATAHPKCSLAMPTTCGLPSGFMRHFSRTWKSNENSNVEQLSNTSTAEGYVKLPNEGNSGWERHYLRLRGTVLEVFASKPIDDDEGPDAYFDLCPPEGCPRVLSAVPCSDVQGTASSDMPFILKVEIVPRTTCWPKNRSLLIMTLSFLDKQKWVQALEAVVQQSCGQFSGSERYKGHCLMTLESGQNSIMLDINCCVELSDQVKNARAKKESRNLVQCDLHQLRSAAEAAECSRPSISMQPVIPASMDPTCCHLFAVSPPSSHNADVILCVATSDKLILLKWNPKQASFIPVKLLDTADPCSCIHFTPHSIIVGCNKFFELDLKNFFVEEFLDSSDPTLTLAVVGTEQLNSFPVSILDVTPPKMTGHPSEPEFLLCFNELGVFVDQFGRRTREDDIKWSHLPLAFVYRRPYIFIVHFMSVEVMKLSPLSFTHGKDDTTSTVNYPDQTFIEMNNPRFLGISGKSGTIYVSTSSTGCCNVLRLDATAACKDDLTLSLTESDGADLNTCGSVEFSFTSSLVQSLDGLDSEANPSTDDNAPFSSRQHVRFDVPHTAL